jgi:hypothetical protein
MRKRIANPSKERLKNEKIIPEKRVLERLQPEPEHKPYIKVSYLLTDLNYCELITNRSIKKNDVLRQFKSVEELKENKILGKSLTQTIKKIFLLPGIQEIAVEQYRIGIVKKDKQKFDETISRAIVILNNYLDQTIIRSGKKDSGSSYKKILLQEISCN